PVPSSRRDSQGLGPSSYSKTSLRDARKSRNIRYGRAPPAPPVAHPRAKPEPEQRSRSERSAPRRWGCPRVKKDSTDKRALGKRVSFTPEELEILGDFDELFEAKR